MRLFMLIDEMCVRGDVYKCVLCRSINVFCVDARIKIPLQEIHDRKCIADDRERGRETERERDRDRDRDRDRERYITDDIGVTIVTNDAFSHTIIMTHNHAEPPFWHVACRCVSYKTDI